MWRNVTSVSTIPGRIATEVTSGSSSARVLQKLLRQKKQNGHMNYLHKEFIAALLALYGAHPAIPLTAAPELTKTTLPLSLLRR